MTLPGIDGYMTHLDSGQAVWIRTVFDDEDGMIVCFLRETASLVARGTMQEVVDTGALRDMQDRLCFHVHPSVRMACKKLLGTSVKPW